MKRDNLPKNHDEKVMIVAFLIAFSFIGSESIQAMRDGFVRTAIWTGLGALVCLGLALALVRHLARRKGA